MRNIFSNSYPGVQTILENVLAPIFGEYTKHNQDILSTFPEKQELAQSANITQIKHVANFMLEDKPLEVFDITLSENARLQYSRVNIQRIVRSVMDVYTGALMFFHYEDNQGDWRISFVEKDDTQSSTTPAKRYTYLVGENHSSRTLNDRLKKLREQPERTITNIREAFSVEKLSDEFFEKYKSIYADFVEYISGKRFVKISSKWEERVTGTPNPQFSAVFNGNDKLVRDYVKKLLGRVVFLYFIQKKGWMGVSVESKEWQGGDVNFLHTLFKNSTSEQQDNFLETVLEPLFFYCLNELRANDIFDTGVQAVGENGNVKIPYLNGGLFENDDIDEFSVLFPKEKFEKLFDFFSQYNFTIDENDPDDAEVGVDPEMLGKIFENLLEDNKDKGAFYTPKEIVQYMCRESLIAYLNEKMPEQDNAVRQLVQEHKVNDSWDESNKQNALQLLKDVKVCDPAIGSGAFPMGMLNELYKCRLALGETKSAEIKKHIIQNNIYGVDIESGAVDIARLRFWLSLVVDEENPQPLPNLDYKIMQGNSLLESFEGIDLGQITSNRDKVSKKYQGMYSLEFDESKTASDIKMLTKEYFDITSHIRKNEIRRLIDEQVKQHIILWGGSTPEIIEKVNQLDFNNKPFFLWHTYFADVFDADNPATDCNTGFDIVLGNPPYIKEYTNRSAFNGFRETSKYYQGKMDLWYGFACHGLDLLSENGVLCFIATNNWTTNGGASKLRKKVIEDAKIIQLLDFGSYMIFEDSASIQTMIMLFQNNKDNDNYTFDYRKLAKPKATKADAIALLDKTLAEAVYLEPTISREFENKLLTFTDSNIHNVLEKIDCGIYFKDNELAQGIVFPQDFLNKKNRDKLQDFEVGDGVFCLSQQEKLNLNLSQEEDKLIKPYFTTEQIKRYITYSDNALWLIYTTSKFKKMDSLDNFPKIKQHLDNFSEVITSDNKPYGLHRAREERFFKGEKIISQRKCVERPSFSYSNFDCYVSATFYIIQTTRWNMKLLTGLLNSKLIEFWLRHKGKMQGNNFQVDKEPLMNIPIKANLTAEIEIAEVVNQILSAKQANPQADTSDLEREIDQLVYQLYELTDEEIAVVEGRE